MTTEKTDKKTSKPAPSGVKPATKAAAKKTAPSGTKTPVSKTIKKTVVKKTTAPAKPVSEVFAVIQTGGKQYLVRPGETLKIEKITKPKKGDMVVFDEILLVFDGKDAKIGSPFVDGAKVTAKIEGDERDKKITVLRYKAKTRYTKKKGHRQTRTKITITEIK